MKWNLSNFNKTCALCKLFFSSIFLACFWWWLICRPKHVTFSTVKTYANCRCDGQSFYVFVWVGCNPKLVKFLQVWTVSVWCQNVRAAPFSPDCPLKLPNDTRRTFIKPRFTIRFHSHHSQFCSIETQFSVAKHQHWEFPRNEHMKTSGA